MEILTGKEIQIEKWNSLVYGSNWSSPFQTPVFFDLINTVPDFSAEIYAAAEFGEIQALCLVTFQKSPGFMGFFSRRAIIYGGPLLKSANHEVFKLLLRAITANVSRRVIYTEIRNLHPYNEFSNIYQRNKWKYLPYQNYVVNCTDREGLLKQMGNNRKRQIKKAIESGVTIKEVNTIEEVIHFYNMMKSLYDKKIGKPIPPIEFFEEFFRKEMGKYLLVNYQNEIIGGIMCPVLKGRCIYELYIFGLDEEYKNQYPSVMATWAALEYAINNKIPNFDFMGAGRKDQDYGVREFKSRFGGELVEYGRYIKINNIILYRIGQLAIKFLRETKK